MSLTAELAEHGSGNTYGVLCNTCVCYAGLQKRFTDFLLVILVISIAVSCLFLVSIV